MTYCILTVVLRPRPSSIVVLSETLMVNRRRQENTGATSITSIAIGQPIRRFLHRSTGLVPPEVNLCNRQQSVWSENQVAEFSTNNGITNHFSRCTRCTFLLISLKVSLS